MSNRISIIPTPTQDWPKLSLKQLKPFAYFAALAASTLASSESWAVDYHSPRTSALGGAGRAGPLLNDAIHLNPSFAAFLKERVSAGFNYINYGPTPSSEGQDGVGELPAGRSYQVSLQDGRSPFFEAGLAYTRIGSGSMIHFGASRSFIERTGFGIGAKFIRESNESPVISDASLSATGILAPGVQSALVIDNLVQNQLSKNAGLYREIALGTKINIMQIVLLYVDPHYTPELPATLGQKLGYAAGAEFVIFRDLFFRTGLYRSSKQPILNTRGDGWGIGGGWLSPKISFDVGFSQTVTPTPSDLWNFGATLYL
jgi:hypothetical protein